MTMFQRAFPLQTLPERSVRLLRMNLRRRSRLHWRRKVGCIVPGIEKSGTSALSAYLGAHPQVCMFDRKEAHYFDDERLFRDEKPDYAFYHAGFRPQAGQTLLAEATARYMYWEDAPRRMAAYNPALKTVIIVRNPIERAYSHWNMLRARKIEKLSFWDALQAEPERLARTPPRVNPRFAYVSRGRYAEQFQRLWRHLPREQSFVFRSDRLRLEPQQVLDEIGSFLGLERYIYPSTEVRRNVGEYVAPMAERERAYLKEVLGPEIRAFEALIGWDCSDWLR